MKGVQQGNEPNHQSPNEVYPDHGLLFGPSVQIDPDQGAKYERRKRLQQTDHRRLESGPRQLVHEPQEGNFVQPVADLGNGLTGKEQSEITTLQQMPAALVPSHRAFCGFGSRRHIGYHSLPQDFSMRWSPSDAAPVGPSFTSCSYVAT